jgi:pimeloyl-ACP methyl ester carboxylesterase
VIALQAAARAPGLYSAYIGVAQMADQLRSEGLAHEFMLERYRQLGNARMVRSLEAARPGATAPLPAAYMSIRDRAMHGLGVGTTRDMKSAITGVFLRSWLCRAYTLNEKVNLWRGKLLSDRLLWDSMMATDLTREVPALELPVYFLHGKHDYTVAYSETRSYFERLAAPLKGFYTFEQSAHSPMFEEPARVRRILVEDVLAGATGLAD